MLVILKLLALGTSYILEVFLVAGQGMMSDSKLLELELRFFSEKIKQRVSLILESDKLVLIRESSTQ